MAPVKSGRNWSEEDLQNAMKAVNRGRGISVREASRRFSVPRRTLRNHINTKSTKKRMGRIPILSECEEQAFVQRISRFAAVGIPLTAKMICSYVYE